MPDTLADWLTYLESLHPKTIALGLERVAQVKQRLNLQANFPIIIVGGTNGKGSVCAMLESILHAAGYRTGCYTSPHLLDYNERVRVSKHQANDAELCAAFAAIERARKGGADSDNSSLTPALSQRARGQSQEAIDIPLTYFEFGTLAAMQMFVEQKVDVAILEVGLGGRLDAVNVFDADCAVVTSIDIDHTDYLGDTREQIAFEKAGIFRAGKVAVFGDPDVPQAIRSEAGRIGAELWCIGSEFGFSLPSPASGGGAGGEGRGVEASSISVVKPLTPPPLPLAGEGVLSGQWNYFGKGKGRAALPLPALRGAYQLNNASTALAALDVLKGKLPVSMEAVRRGLVEVVLPARFQMVPSKPTLILDVAHNPHAARSLAQNLAALPPCPRTYAVIAMLKDKDMAGVVAALKPQVDVWLVAGIDAPRGASADELGQVLLEAQAGEVLRFATASEALHHACNQAGENDRILALGSFYTVAEVMRARGLGVV